jgi:hypothetical protein
VGAITAAVVLYYENKTLKGNIEKQNTTIKDLQNVTKAQGKVINTITITFETMKSTVEAFKANPPSTYDEKINGIYRIMNIYHNNNSNSHNPPELVTTNPQGVPNTNTNERNN